MNWYNERTVFVAAGVGLLTFSAHVIVEGGGGYVNANAYLTLYLAACVAIGSFAFASALRERKYRWALGVFLALVAAELFGFGSTTDRKLLEIEKDLAPRRHAIETYRRAEERVKSTTDAITNFTSSARLTAATEAKSAFDAGLIAKSAERNCLAHCRALLEQQGMSLSAEVAAARQEEVSRRANVDRELREATTAFEGIAMPSPVSPMAKKLDIEPSSWGLILAFLYSVGVNFMGMMFIGLGAHLRPHGEAVQRPDVAITTPPIAIAVASNRIEVVEPEAELLPPKDTKQRKRAQNPDFDWRPVVRFLRDHAPESEADEIDIVLCYSEFLHWRDRQIAAGIDVPRVAAAEFRAVLDKLVHRDLCKLHKQGGTVVIVGRKLDVGHPTWQS